MKARSAILAVVILSAIITSPFNGFSEEAAPIPTAGAYPEGLVYTVVEGDTLWDLSSKYLGSPWKWQELWERNRFITNPHYI